jgi:hypothetical protein
MRASLAIWLLALLPGLTLAQGSQDALRNTYSLDSETRFWAEVRQRDSDIARLQSQYRDSQRSAWNSEAVARAKTPQQARIEEINARVQATHRASAADFTEVGMDLYFGDGVPVNRELGMYFLKQAGDEHTINWHYAQFVLGTIYWNGKGTKPDPQAGLDWFRLAAGNGNVLAQSKLIEALVMGERVPKDVAEAARWADRLEHALFDATIAPASFQPGSAPGSGFADDAQRASAAVAVAGLAVLGLHDLARGRFWLGRAAQWGCKSCAALVSQDIAAPIWLRIEPYQLGLQVLGVNIMIPPYRGEWSAAPWQSNTETRQALRLSGGTTAGAVIVTLARKTSGTCGNAMLALELRDGLPRISLPALAPERGLEWLNDWYFFALQEDDGLYAFCRDIPGGFLVVTVLSEKEGRPRTWVAPAFDAVRPIVNQVAAALH